MKTLLSIIFMIMAAQAFAQTNTTTRIDFDTPKLHPEKRTEALATRKVSWRSTDFVSSPVQVRFSEVDQHGGQVKSHSIEISSTDLVTRLAKSYARTMEFPPKATTDEKVTLSKAEARKHLRKLASAIEWHMLSAAGDLVTE